MKKLITVLIAFTALLSFNGCKATKEVQYVDRWHEKNTIDSIYIQSTDSFVQTQKGDTIFRDRWKTFYKDRVIKSVEKDSAYFNIAKTVEVPVEVIKYKWSFLDYIGLIALLYGLVRLLQFLKMI